MSKAMKITEEKFREMLVDAAVEDGYAEREQADAWEYGAFCHLDRLTNKPSGLSRVIFDTENRTFTEDFAGIMTGFRAIGDTVVLFGSGGGDWEGPISFCLYVGVDGKVHGYVPEHGNTYDKTYNTAYGSQQESEDYRPTNPDNVVPIFGFDPDDIGQQAPPVDNELLLADVTAFLAT